MLQPIPIDLQSEIELLAILLNNSDLAGDVVEKISANFFYDNAHKNIYSTMKKMVDLRINISPKSILKYSTKNKGGVKLEDIVEINNQYLTSVYLDRYINKVKDNYHRRECIKYAQELIISANTEDLNISNTIDSTMNNLFNLEQINDNYETTLEQELAILYNEASDPKSAKDNQIKVGMYEFDRITGGLPIGEVTIIAARPSVGKTAFGMFVAQNLARKRFVGIMSIEMSQNKILKRMLACHSGINSSKLGKYELNPKEKNSAAKAIGTIQNLKFIIDDTPGIKISEICKKLRFWKKEHKMEVAVIDYLQYIHPDPGTKYQNKNAEVTEISRSLKEIAKELNIALVVLSQLSRPERGTSRPPVLADLRDSGSIEQDGDLIMFLHPEGENSEDFICETGLYIRKNREGGTGKIALKYDKKISSFKEAIDNSFFSED